MNTNRIEIYTDGSCNSRERVGAWAALILLDDKKEVLSGIAYDTTHNRMELFSVIKAIDFLDAHKPGCSIRIYTDSQYVCTLPDRLPRLNRKAYITNRGNKIQNADLINAFLHLIKNHDIEWAKVKAHQTDNSEQTTHNRFVDKLARKLVRDSLANKD